MMTFTTSLNVIGVDGSTVLPTDERTLTTSATMTITEQPQNPTTGVTKELLNTSTTITTAENGFAYQTMQKSIHPEDLLLTTSTVTTKDGENEDTCSVSVYSVTSDWVINNFFPSSSNKIQHDESTNIANRLMEGSNDDASSTSSSSIRTMRYFEPSDFLPQQNWEELSAAQIGFAVVAGGFFCFHPVMFIAGVLTAIGTLQAAGATYDYCESSSTILFCGRNDTTTSDVLSPADVEKVLSDVGQAPPGPTIIPQYPLNCDENTDEALDAGEGGEQSMRQVSQITFSEDSGPLPDQPIEESIKTKDENLPSTTDARIQPSASSLSRLDAQEALQWVETLYPPLPTTALDMVEFHGLNAKEFFNVFFSDDAPFGFEAFHKIRCDKNVRYGQWETLEGVQKPCLLSQAPTLSTDSQPVTLHLPPVQERVIEYEAKTNSFLGPPFAKTTKVQRALLVSNKLLVLEMKTTLTDIPFSNRFYVMERWLISSESHPEGTCSISSSEKRRKRGRHSPNQQPTPDDKNITSALNHHSSRRPKMTSTAFLTVTSQVIFTQHCAFETTILKESAKQISDISIQWNKMAQEGLKRTEETRRQRLQEEKSDDDYDEMDPAIAQEQTFTTKTTQAVKECSTCPLDAAVAAGHENDESIEIRHMGPHNSWVAGEESYLASTSVGFLQDHSSNASSKNKQIRRRKSGRQSFSRSLTNLIARRRSPTKDGNETITTSSMELQGDSLPLLPLGGQCLKKK